LVGLSHKSFARAKNHLNNVGEREHTIPVKTNGKPTTTLALGAAVAILTLLARAWGMTQVGLTHYDEGVYLLSSFWPLRHGDNLALFPWQKLFSPPAYFGLVGLVNWVLGRASDVHAIAINVTLGWLTVIAAYWAAKKWFGARAGIAAAVLTGFSQFQIAFSRSALTDTGFTFFFLISLALIAISLEENMWMWAIAAGLAIGVTWNMKYHGWILLALAFMAAALKTIGLARQSEKIKKLAFSWLVMTGVAVVAFLPWLLYTQFRLGGYAEVNEFHARFMNFRWAHNFRLQTEMQLYFDGWLSRISPALALVSAAVFSPGWPASFIPLIAAALLLLCASWLFGATLTCLILALLSIPKVWRTGSDFGRLLIITFATFFFLLPCYQAFARLLLPFSVVTMLLAGCALNFFLESRRVREAFERFSGAAMWKRAAWLAGAAGLAILVIAEVKHPAPRTWTPESSYRDAVREMASIVPANAAVFVIAEPELAFYFQNAGRQTFCICIDPRTYQKFQAAHPFRSDPNAPQYVVAGFYAKEWWNWSPVAANSSGQYRMMARVPAPPSDIRLLDDFPTAESRKTPEAVQPMYDLYLYRRSRAQAAARSDAMK
jgi:dolichyl-phosphate-mannose-protein mannosyltransferase